MFKVIQTNKILEYPKKNARSFT